jgi:CHAT domain-containing protein
LLIVSDGSLQYVPFAALPGPDRLDDSGLLVVRHEIVNLPSASVLGELRREAARRPHPKGKVAVVADPVFDETDSRVVPAVVSTASHNVAGRSMDLLRSANDLGLSRNGKLYLNRLLYTRREAEAVLALVEPGERFSALDFDASRKMVMSGKLTEYRIVHFATHGLLNNKHPELSGLVFSLVDRKGRRQEGFLKLQNVYDLKLSAELVVLSACDTGLGEAIDGEGLIGLTRGFMYAGATRVLATLWGVSDIATASFMTEFYRAMQKEGMLPAAALRAAQLHMLAQPHWQSPFFWAAFQLQGEWR